MSSVEQGSSRCLSSHRLPEMEDVPFLFFATPRKQLLANLSEEFMSRAFNRKLSVSANLHIEKHPTLGQLRSGHSFDSLGI